MREVVETKLLFINSDDANIRLSNDDIFVDINTTFMRVQDPDNEHIEVCLSEFVANRNFYSVDDTNNRYSIYYNSTDHFYTLNNGFPNILDINAQLKTALQTEFAGQTFLVSYIRQTGNIRIECDFSGATPPADLQMNFAVDNSCYREMGFTYNYHPFNIVGTVVDLEGDAPVNVLGERKEVFVRSSLVSQSQSNTLDGLNNTDLLGKIPISVEPLANIVYQDSGAETYRQPISTKDVLSFNIRLTTSDPNQLIGLKSNFLMLLTFYKMAERRNTTEELLSELVEIERLKFIRDDKELSAQ